MEQDSGSDPFIEMDFIETITATYDKLTNKEAVNMLWIEMVEETRTSDSLECMVEYGFHYPIDSDAYLIKLDQKFDQMDKEKLRRINGRLKAYLITFLYYCTTKFNRAVPYTTTILASKLYLKLVCLPDIGKYFYEANMLKLQVFNILGYPIESGITDQQKIEILNLVKKYCLEEKVDIVMLRSISTAYVFILLTLSKAVPQDINNFSDLQRCCANAIKQIILNETEGKRITVVGVGLFKCLLKECVLFLDNKKARQHTLLLFIRDLLQDDIDDAQFQYILEAFCIIWGKPTFIRYEEAVIILNVFKIEYYKEVLRKMVLYTQSKNHNEYLINIMHLVVAIAENLPSYPLDKIEPLYSCAMRNIIYRFMDTDDVIKNAAVETMARICTMKNNTLLSSIFNQIGTSAKFVNLDLMTMFLTVDKIVDERWGTSPKNHRLLIIVSKFLTSTKVPSARVEKTLQAICRECTPFSLKPCLDLLHKLFCNLALKQEDESATTVLKILFRCAMHQDATSMDFALHLFRSMLNASVIEGITYHPKYYYNLFLTSEFEYELLFTKCQLYIKREYITNIIADLDHNTPKGAVLLNCLLNYVHYNEISVIVEYFTDNFNEIVTSSMMAPFSEAFRKTLVNRGTASQMEVPRLDYLHGLILESLFQQTIQARCIKPAFGLLQELRKILKIADDAILDQLLTVTSERALRRMYRRELGDNSVFLYLHELCLLMRKVPSENVLRTLEEYMNDTTKLQEMETNMPEIYIDILNLFTTMAMMTKRRVPMVVKYLEEVLSNDSQIYRMVAFKLYYSLCKEITHEFDRVIRFAFKEMVVSDPCLTRLCVIAIEELVFEDFIKLDAEHFFKFVHVLGSDALNIFMKEVLLKRFLLSNQNDITKYYVQCIMYIHIYGKLPDYPISEQFDEELVRMKMRLDCPKEIPVFLFNNLTIKKKFNVLNEISDIVNDITRGSCKFDDNFYPVLRDLLVTFKLIATSSMDSKVERHYYDNVCEMIKTKIVKRDETYSGQIYYQEFEHSIRKCTVSLLALLFMENRQISDNIQITLFDALMHWIDFVKDEIIHYIHNDRGRDYANYFNKLIQYYQRNKGRFATPDTVD